jgi:hypothetical protein
MQLLKTTAPRLSSRASAPFGLLVAFLIAGPVTFAACGDDGNVLGSDNGAGGSAGSMSSAGSAHAGTQASAGKSSGGTTAGGSGNGGDTMSGGETNSGGANSSGGTTAGGGTNAGGRGGTGALCETAECARANVCLDKCGGTVLYTGCCRCDANQIEQTTCASGGGGGQGSTDCAGTTCTASQTCVAYRTVGGAIFTPDAQGMCMSGKHVEGDKCQADFAYTCAELTGCSAPSTTCHCATGTKCSNANACRLPSPAAWLDASADLVCEQQAP